MDHLALRYFVQIAELGSVTRAADLLHIAQPSLSRHISQLEHSIGTTLFVRSRSGVTLTEAGAVLLERAKTILMLTDAARDEVMTYATEPTGSVTLGLPALMLRGIGNRLVARYCLKYPEVQLRVHDGPTMLLEDLWLENQIDVAMLPDGAQNRIRNAEFTPLISESLYIVGPRSAGFRKSEPVGLEEVLPELDCIPLVLAGRPGQWRFFCEAAFQSAGRKFKAKALVDSSNLMIDLVSEGVGYCLMSHEAIRDALDEGRISAAPVRNQTISWVLAVSRKRPFSPAILELKRTAIEAIQEWIDSGQYLVAPLRGSPLRAPQDVAAKLSLAS